MTHHCGSRIVLDKAEPPGDLLEIERLTKHLNPLGIQWRSQKEPLEIGMIGHRIVQIAAGRQEGGGRIDSSPIGPWRGTALRWSEDHHAPGFHFPFTVAPTGSLDDSIEWTDGAKHQREVQIDTGLHHLRRDETTWLPRL